MKRILTLAIAAMLVVAFAIPTLAAPKVELVGGKVSTTVDYAAGTEMGVQVPTLDYLKFKFSADNFVFNVKFNPNFALDTDDVVPGTTLVWNLVSDYDFSLALPGMTLSGVYNEYTSLFGYHGGREIRLASDEKFAEMAGFNWAVYTNDDNAKLDFDSAHAQISVPVGENFTGSLNWAYEGDHLGYLDLSYTISEGLSVSTQIAKNIDAATDDFFGALTVNFPITEGFKGTFFAQYGMAGFVPDTDFLNYGGYWNGYDAYHEAYLDFAYNNENTNAELFVDYASKSADFADLGKVIGFAEYVSNGKNSLWSSNSRRANYADTEDGYGRNWNTQFAWVRGNSGNEFAVRVNGSYDLYTTVDSASATAAENLYSATAYAMFAPDAIPVVVTFKGTYAHKYVATYDAVTDAFIADEYITAWGINNWIGVRLNEDIHLAIWDRYNMNDQTLGTVPATGFEVDAALVYNRDSVTAKLTGTNLTSNYAPIGFELYLGLEF